ncbi:TniQ family protein [Hydrogenophaga sp.]|uniref:TniQ family protein n=1 Tax=Hydrogenophaga sp. TaxID=1904254 RepID=UPI0035AEBC86
MMIIPKILPDELLLSYRGRLMALNGTTNVTEIANLTAWALRVDTSVVPGPVQLLVESLARFNDLSVAELVQNHTCAATLALPTAPAEYLYTSGMPTALTGRLMFSVGHTQFQFCPDCVREDLQAHYFSYWRRSHQLPGRHLCPVHRTPLLGVSQRGALTSTPDQHLGEAEFAPEELLAAEASSVMVQRALALLDWAVQSGIFIDRARLAEVLGSRWSMLAQERSVAATDAALHNYILEQFPLVWLRAWISPQKLEAGPIRSFVRQLIWTDLGHLTLLEVMVAAVALFDTDEAAQKALVTSMSTFISKKQCVTAEHLQVA